MPSNTKTPLKGSRKKVSKRKIRKSVNGNTQGSYLEEHEQTAVSTSSSTDPISSAPSNQTLIQRVDRIEQRNFNDHVTINQTSQSSEQPLQGHGPLASTSCLPQPQQFHTPTQVPLIGNETRA